MVAHPLPQPLMVGGIVDSCTLQQLGFRHILLRFPLCRSLAVYQICVGGGVLNSIRIPE